MTGKSLSWAVLALTACQSGDGSEQPTAPDGEPTETHAAPEPVPTATGDRVVPVDRLAGEYRIAGVDGGDINLPHGITAAIGEDRIDVTSQCVEMAWSYRLEGTALETTRIPVVTCDRGRYPEEEAIEAAFTAAREVERTASNGLRFSGGGRSVTLFTQ